VPLEPGVREQNLAFRAIDVEDVLFRDVDVVEGRVKGKAHATLHDSLISAIASEHYTNYTSSQVL
jgi:hypothetical protein